MTTQREFITLLGGAAAWPVAAQAQQAERMRRIGVLINMAADDPEAPGHVAALAQATRTMPTVFVALQLRSPPAIGRYAPSCGSWSPYSVTGTIPMALSEAIIATYITIHIADPR